MEPDKERVETPKSIADAVEVVVSAQQADEAQVAVPAELIEQPVVRAGEVAPKQKAAFFKQKKILIAATVCLLVLIGGGLFLTLNGKDDDEEALQSQSATLGVAVTVLDGKASSSADGETWQALSTRSRLSEGDYVRTDTGSRVVLGLDDGSALRFDEVTSVRLESLDAQDVRIEHRTGKVYSRVVESDRKFTVAVDATEYVAEGTAFQTASTATEKGVKVLQSGVKFDDITISEGKQYYAQHSDTAYVEKITDISLDELKADGFLLWNLEQDEKDSEFKNKLGYWEKIKSQPSSPEVAPAGAKIELTARNDSKGTVLSWTVAGISAPDGFKVVRSQSSVMPAFGKDESQHVSSSGARSFTWSGTKSGAFHYRVCVYRASDSSCSVYSNTVTMEAVVSAPEAVVPGAVTLSLSEDMINWTFAGTAPHGFKVVVSSSENPVYPKDAEYFGGAPYTLKTRPSGTYYVRVCKYTASDEIAGGCTDYSNQVIWVVP